jgi:hypothetical protein
MIYLYQENGSTQRIDLATVHPTMIYSIMVEKQYHRKIFCMYVENLADLTLR